MTREQNPNTANPELSRIIQLEATEAEVTIAALISHVRRLEAALEKSVIDPTTGVLNKNGYEQLVLPDLERTLQEGSKWAVLFGDLDNFKYVNDTYGHTSGDLALRLVGRAINESIRPYDHAVRWGGDEFCLFLKDPEAHDDVEPITSIADEVATRIVEALDRNLIEEHSELSISFGSSAIKNIDDIESAIHRADLEALSHKKRPR